MIGPLVVCCVCLMCLPEEGSARPNSTRPIRKPKRRRELDALLCEGLGEGLDASELVAYVLGRLHPGRDFQHPTDADQRTIRQVTHRVRRRLQSPDLVRRCRRRQRHG